jgi:kynurenine formamidase
MKVKNYFDLSVEVKTNMPCWPTNPLVRVDPVGIMARDGYSVERYESVTHSGTHIDAPYHMIDGARTVDRIPLEQIIGQGYCIRPEIEGTEIHGNALEKVWKPEYDGKIILVNTGWDKKRAYSKEFQYDFPGFADDAVKFLIAHKPKLLGIDSLGIDPHDHTDFRVHKALLATDMAFIEDLTNLDKLTPGKEYFIMALPLKLYGASGSMARVVELDID